MQHVATAFARRVGPREWPCQLGPALAAAEYGVAVSAPRGSFLTVPSIGQPLQAEALRYAEQHSAPGEAVLTLPIATTLNFLADRPLPVARRDRPSGLSDGGQGARRHRTGQGAPRAADLCWPIWILLSFVIARLGLDYNQEFWRWIEAHYRVVARFDTPASAWRQAGGEAVFYSGL
jgi:hypothetical protein